MDILIRVIAILIEVIILAVIMFSLLFGMWLTIFNLGLAARYKKAVTMVLVMIGVITVVFFIAHLASFYPGGDVR